MGRETRSLYHPCQKISPPDPVRTAGDAIVDVGVPIVTEKKTTNFQLTAVQDAFSKTMVIEKPQDLRKRPRDSASSRFSITALECDFSNQPIEDGFREGETL
jgi:hypothetical protein